MYPTRKTWDSPNSFEQSDLFTINFFASEVTRLGDPAREYFKLALTRAKSGALVLLNDNNDARFYDWVDKVADAAGFARLLANQGDRKIYDTEERLSALGKYAKKFGGHSKLTGRLAWLVFQKN